MKFWEKVNNTTKNRSLSISYFKIRMAAENFPHSITILAMGINTSLF